ncbi:putative protein lysine methyltransferase SET5 [Cryptococcus deuterogattii LA55]|nr:putative protein lysine methyltransferase SET5 [Cryptococcus deuterogattii LA55]KIR94713.1 putative protein lysine methyltransferase SET5 [Cryptococcus deuterogattii CBS 10090]
MTDLTAEAAISPSDDILLPALASLRENHPDKGILKLLAQLKVDHPEWAVSEKRFRKALQLAPSPGDGEADPSEKALVADTGLDPSIDVKSIAPKVEVKMFAGGKGKGLVAKEGLKQGEMLWQEEPWIVTSDPGHYSLLTQSMMCSQCFSLFARPSPPLSVPCPHCITAHFCNRLCYTKSLSSSHLPLLCPGLNPDASSLMDFIRKRGERSVEGVAKILARWRGEREWGAKGKAEEMEKRIWKGMARVSQKRKEMERREWSYISKARMEEWHLIHIMLINVLNPSPTHENYKSFQRLLISQHPRRFRPVPLTEKEVKRWFSFESFLELLGLVGLNQEDSGGLYALHAHLNHSCEPNIQVRNLPKSYTPPTQETLPVDLPPPIQAGDKVSNKLTILARHGIQPGEELTISYVNMKMPRDERRQALREGYGFWCACDRCVREKEGPNGEKNE